MKTEQEIKDKIQELNNLAQAHRDWVRTSTSEEEEREARRHLRETNYDIQTLRWVLDEPEPAKIVKSSESKPLNS